MLKVAKKKALKVELEKNGGNIEQALLSIKINPDSSTLKEARHLAKQWGFRKNGDTKCLNQDLKMHPVK